MGTRREFVPVDPLAQKHEKILRALQKTPGNRKCFNCDCLGSSYVVPQCGIFVCTDCSGKHMAVGQRVKSVSMGKFTSDEIRLLEEEGGNENAALRYLAKWTADSEVHKPLGKNPRGVETWIKAVFVDKRFFSNVDLPVKAPSPDHVPVRRLSDALGNSGGGIKLEVGPLPPASTSSTSSAPAAAAAATAVPAAAATAAVPPPRPPTSLLDFDEPTPIFAPPPPSTTSAPTSSSQLTWGDDAFAAGATAATPYAGNTGGRAAAVTPPPPPPQPFGGSFGAVGGTTGTGSTSSSGATAVAPSPFAQPSQQAQAPSAAAAGGVRSTPFEPFATSFPESFSQSPKAGPTSSAAPPQPPPPRIAPMAFGSCEWNDFADGAAPAAAAPAVAAAAALQPPTVAAAAAAPPTVAIPPARGGTGPPSPAGASTSPRTQGAPPPPPPNRFELPSDLFSDFGGGQRSSFQSPRGSNSAAGGHQSARGVSPGGVPQQYAAAATGQYSQGPGGYPGPAGVGGGGGSMPYGARPPFAPSGPAHGGFPQGPGAFPQGQGGFPPPQGAFPQGQGAFPPSFPPSQGAFPPSHGAFPSAGAAVSNGGGGRFPSPVPFNTSSYGAPPAQPFAAASPFGGPPAQPTAVPPAATAATAAADLAFGVFIGDLRKSVPAIANGTVGPAAPAPFLGVAPASGSGGGGNPFL